MSDAAGVRPASRVPRHADVSGEGPTLDTWQDAPHNRWALARVSEFVPTVPISRDVRTPDDGAGTVSLDSLRRHVPDLDRRLVDSFTDAFLIVNHGRVVGEYYKPGFRSDDMHLLMSVSKSICGLTVGVLADAGLLDVTLPVRHYVADLSGSAYGDATVQQVLDMTVDVDYDEDYSNPHSHVRVQDRVAGWLPRYADDPADTYEFLAMLRGGGEHGARFRYCSAGTDVLAWVVENATGLRYAEALSRWFWAHLGCRDDATITVDPGGCAFANGGISCTATDLARVGQLMLDDGTLDGTKVVSSEWVRATMRGGDPLAARGTAYQRVHPNGSYRNQWWVTGNDRGNVYAVGIHGQFIWVDPPSQTVIVKFSSWPEPVTEEWNRFHSVLFRDVCEVLERGLG